MDLNKYYKDNGYCRIPNFLTPCQIGFYESIIQIFHQQWLVDNAENFEQGVLNSAYITTNKPHSPLNDSQRQALFQLIASRQLTETIRPLFANEFRFMGSQLFFNPKNIHQKNYWHRDGQYHLSLEEQKKALTDSTVLHCRIALRDELGVELVPGSHHQWDSDNELSVRMQTDGRNNYDALETGNAIPLAAGDLLVFSANMIHRGLYGGDRLALDILYCDDNPELLSFRPKDCLPHSEHMKMFEVPSVFEG